VTVGSGDNDKHDNSSLPELFFEINGTILLKSLDNLDGLVLLLEELLHGSVTGTSGFNPLTAIFWEIYVETMEYGCELRNEFSWFVYIL
jgi:hypothetical protein